MADQTQTTGHRVPDGLCALRAQVLDLAAAGLLTLDADGTREALRQVTALAAQVASLELALAAHGEEVHVEDASGATNAGVWWAVATHQTRPSAVGKVRLSRRLEDRWHLVRDGLRSGRMLAEQARVIVKALDALPDDVDSGVLDLAEKTLVDYANDFDATELAEFGRKILSIVAPEIGEELDRLALEKAEREASQKTRLTMSKDGHGSVNGRFRISEMHADMLERALQSIAAPKHQVANKNGEQDREGAEGLESLPVAKVRPTAERMGQAFTELIETLNPATLPQVGRMNATIVVRLDLDALMSGLGSATLDTGTTISASQARRLACEATLVPMVFDGDSIVDHGRGQRFYDHHQRLQMGIRDKTCTALGCDWPAHLCHAHHDIAYSQGGRTDIKDGRMLCPRHHARIHDPAYEHRITPDNQVTFHRRT